jgi:hypothetical protein
MKYKIKLSFEHNPIDGVVETVEANNVDEAQEIAVSLASSIYETDSNLGTWIIEEVEELVEVETASAKSTYTSYNTFGYDELSVSYSPYMVSFSQNADNDPTWTCMGYSTYSDFNGDGYIFTTGETSASGEPAETGYSPYLTASNEKEQEGSYTPYVSATTPATSNEGPGMDANQIAGYAAVSAPADFKASCSYHKTLPNGYLPYRSSWIVAVKPGQTLVV